MGLLDDLRFVLAQKASRKPPPVYVPDPPSREAYEDALAMVSEMRKERDRWADSAAFGERQLRQVRAERDAAWAEIESLRDEMGRLKAADGVRGFERAASASLGPDDLGSWSGLREGE